MHRCKFCIVHLRAQNVQQRERVAEQKVAVFEINQAEQIEDNACRQNRLSFGQRALAHLVDRDTEQPAEG